MSERSESGSASAREEERAAGALWRPVARVGDLRAGDVIAAQVGGVELVVGRDGDHYFAVQRRCLHRGGDLAEGIISRGHLLCPVHFWRFSTATGQHDGAAEFCLRRYPVRIANDHIEVCPEPIPAPPAPAAPATEGAPT